MSLGALLTVCFLINMLASIKYEHMTSEGKDVVELVTSEEQSKPVQVTNGMWISHPYLLYENAPGYFAHGFRQHNSRGYRGKEFGEKDGRFRILLLGGSTTYSWSVKDPTRTWPAKLEAMLGETQVEIINAGVGYATSAEMLARYFFKDRYLKPDMVIIHTGGNDIIPLWYPNYNPEYTHFRTHGPQPYVGPLERQLLKVALFRYLYALNWANAKLTHLYHPYSYNKIPDLDALQRSRETPLDGFERNLDLLIRTIKSDSAVPIVFGFLQNREEYLSKKRPDLVGKERALVVGLERTYRVMRDVTGRYGVQFVDPKQEEYPEHVFVDNCHLNEEGDLIKARVLFEAIHLKIFDLIKKRRHNPAPQGDTQ